MDPVAEIKARLPIEQLVGQYCQLQKKGRSFICVCPFHNDTHPSFLVSPDKGIAYCFACQTGGDVFSFYQAIEGVDFPQALKDLAAIAGVTLPDRPMEHAVHKDEKERMRECLINAREFYRRNLQTQQKAMEYLASRGVPAQQIEQFELGVAPDSFTATYDHLLKAGFSRSEIIAAGLGIQKDLGEQRIYDRFRNRLMFPIGDVQGRIIGFGGRTLGDDDAKYINSNDGPLYHKSEVLFGLHHAKEEMRRAECVYMVEGYFDVLACHRVGVPNVVAVSGTALTQEHVRLIKRSCQRVILCLDQDRAGRDAAERAYLLCAAEDLQVHAVRLTHKDPADAAVENAEALAQLLKGGAVPYLDTVIDELQSSPDLGSAPGKHAALARLLPLLKVVPTSVEQAHYVERCAALLQSTPTVVQQDLDRFLKQGNRTTPVRREPAAAPTPRVMAPFASCEVALGLVALYPHLRTLLDGLIPPEEPFSMALFAALRAFTGGSGETIPIEESHRERLGILLLYCEEHQMTGWSDSNAEREIRKNCRHANHEILQRKQRGITEKLLVARSKGDKEGELELSLEYHEVLKLAKLSL